MKPRDAIRRAVRILEVRMPRTLLKTCTVQEIYLMFTDGKPFKVKPVPRKRPRGGMWPTKISNRGRKRYA